MMEGLARGIPGAQETLGAPPASPAPFAVWGQEWLTLRIVPRAMREGLPWHSGVRRVDLAGGAGRRKPSFERHEAGQIGLTTSWHLARLVTVASAIRRLMSFAPTWND